MQASTLRPGLLISLKTSVRGNVKYATLTLEDDHITDAGERKARWETLRTISDPDEHERAIKARANARNKVTAVCAASGFGLLCPEDKVRQLDDAVAEANAIVAEFNATASLTRLDFYLMAGRIVPDDVQAVRAINSEVVDLMDRMNEGLSNLDVQVVREAAKKAKSLGSMLTDDARERVQSAIDLARKAARQIVEAGEQGAVEIDRVTMARITEARAAFLDIDEQGAIGDVEHASRTVDLSPEVEQAAEEYSERLIGGDVSVVVPQFEI